MNGLAGMGSAMFGHGETVHEEVRKFGRRFTMRAGHTSAHDLMGRIEKGVVTKAIDAGGKEQVEEIRKLASELRDSVGAIVRAEEMAAGELERTLGENMERQAKRREEFEERLMQQRREMDTAFRESLGKLYEKHGVTMPEGVPEATGLVLPQTSTKPPKTTAPTPSAPSGESIVEKTVVEEDEEVEEEGEVEEVGEGEEEG